MKKAEKPQSAFERIRQGLDESIAHVRGELSLKTTTLAAPAPALSKTRVIGIRKKTGMSQAVFASYLNVPKKTLQSWEQGARAPKAGEARLLQIADADPQHFADLVARSGVKRPTRRRGRSAAK
jgi:putative transcriptional regulator